MFVIAGVTGNTGSVVADTLLAQGKKVRVIVRDAAKGERFRAGGAEVAVGSIEDEAFLTKTLTGADGAYFLSPPDVQSTSFIAQRRQTLDTIANAVEKSGVGHVVLLSSIAAQHESGTGPIRTVAYGERRLAQTSAKLTFVRAAWFLENWAPSLEAAKLGKLPTFLPLDAPLAMVSVKDIGPVAANALLEGPPSGKVDIIELAGPREENSRSIAATIGKILGKPVEADLLPLDAVVPTLTSFGVSNDVASLLAELYAGAANGLIAFEGDGARFVRGKTDAETVFRALLGATPVTIATAR